MSPRPLAPAVSGAILASLLLFAGNASAHGATIDPDPAVETTSDADDGPGWGPILGACMGVLFGGMLAVWQIRSMRSRS